MGKTTIRISGMTCNHCKARVENALKGLDGVTEAVVDLSDAKADVEFDETKVTVEKMAEVVEDTGYTVVK